MVHWAENALTEAELNDFKRVMIELNQMFYTYSNAGLISSEPYYESVYSSILDETVCVVAGEKLNINVDAPVLPDRWEYWYERFTQEVSPTQIEYYSS
jgi:hypothetical protein